MEQITAEQMLDYLEMNRNHHLGDAMDMSLRRAGFKDTPQEQLNNWVAEAEHEANIAEAIINKLEEFMEVGAEVRWANKQAEIKRKQAEWDAKPQEEKDRIEKEQQAEIGEMLDAIRKRREEAQEAMKGGV